MFQYHKRAFVYYLSVIVTIIIINIKITLQIDSFHIINNDNIYKQQQQQQQQYKDNNLLINKNVMCDIPNESDKGLCIVINKCKAYEKLKNLSFNEITSEHVNFMKSVQCFDDDDNININNNKFNNISHNKNYEPKVCCPKNLKQYKNPILPFTLHLSKSNYYNFSKKINLTKKHKRRIEKVNKNLQITLLTTTTTTTPTPSSSEISNNECGKQIINRIFGGEIAELDEFPWMALLVYNTNEFGCSGALINENFILTAAHCIEGKVAREKRGLKYIRLGEFNIQTQPDCIEEKNNLNCADDSLDFRIEKTIVHPYYNESSKDKFHDIALIKLRRNVQFTHFIMPICLPQSNATKSLETGQYLSVSGWGRTDLFNKYSGTVKSPIKLKLKVPIVSKSNCLKLLRSYGVDLGKKQICAGGELSKDTCAGDSGGPLMYFDQKIARWVTYGIVSYGFTECGMAGHPTVYTDVSQYIDWILDTIKNEEKNNNIRHR